MGPAERLPLPFEALLAAITPISAETAAKTLAMSLRRASLLTESSLRMTAAPRST